MSTSTVSVTVTQLNILGIAGLSQTWNLAPGTGNGFSLPGGGAVGGASHRWCRFEYTGAPNAVRAYMAVTDGTTGIHHAVYEAR